MSGQHTCPQCGAELWVFTDKDTDDAGNTWQSVAAECDECGYRDVEEVCLDD